LHQQKLVLRVKGQMALKITFCSFIQKLTAISRGGALPGTVYQLL